MASPTLTAVDMRAQPKTGGTGILLDAFFGQDGSRISEVTWHCPFACVMRPGQVEILRESSQHTACDVHAHLRRLKGPLLVRPIIQTKAGGRGACLHKVGWRRARRASRLF